MDIKSIWNELKEEYGSEAYTHLLVDKGDAHWKLDNENWVDCPSNEFVENNIYNTPKYFILKTTYYGK